MAKEVIPPVPTDEFISAPGSAGDLGFAVITTASKGGSLTTTMFSTLLGKKKPSENFRERRVFAQ